MDIELAAKRLDALGSAPRLTLFRALAHAGQSGISVRRLQEQAGIASASTLSHHLKRLVAAGLVVQERRSTTLICRTNAAAFHELTVFLSEDRDDGNCGHSQVVMQKTSTKA
jgi:ArsR family transcriptional regulator